MYSLPGMLPNKDHLHAISEIYSGGLSHKTYIIMCLEIRRDIQLMHPNRRRSPTATLQRIQRPAFAIIPARILLPGHLSMDLDHGIQHVLDVFEFGPGGETDAEIGTGVAG